MTASTVPASGGWRRAIVASIVLIALLIAMGAAWAANFARGNILPIMPLAGVVGPATMAEHRFQLATALLPLSPTDLKGMRDNLRHAPLASEPFVAAIRLEPESPRNADRVARALARDPRSSLVRIVALQGSIARGDVPGAMTMLAQVNALNQEQSLPIIKALTSSVRSPAQLDELVVAMRRHPSLIGGFVEGFLQNSPPPDLLRRLMRTAPASVFENPGLREMAVGQLIAADAIDEAVRLAAVPPRADGAFVDDPTFRNRSPKLPFGWRIFQNEVGASEFSANGLVVEFFGRRSGPLLEQIVALPVGRSYQARAAYQSHGRSAGNLRLTVRCAANRRILAQTPLKPTNTEGRAAGQFTVPNGGCRGQVIAIEAQRDDGFGRDTFTIRRLDIVAG